MALPGTPTDPGLATFPGVATPLPPGAPVARWTTRTATVVPASTALVSVAPYSTRGNQ